MMMLVTEMSQLEYGDFYKFVASVGIALLIVAFAVPWLFLREPLDFGMEESRLLTVPQANRDILLKRQSIVGVIINAIPYFSAVTALVGLGLSCYGLKKWKDRQKVRDRGEDVVVERNSRELVEMSKREVQLKATAELQVAEDEVAPVQQGEASVSSSVTSYLKAEQALFKRIQDCFGSSVKVEPHLRMSDIEFDAIIRLDDGERVVLEIKYIRRGFNRGWLMANLDGLHARTLLSGYRFEGAI